MSKSFGAFFTRPIFDVFFFVAVAVLIYSAIKEIRAGRAKKTAQK